MLVLGDGAVTVRGKTQKPRLGWPVNLDPSQTTTVKLKVGRMASMNVSWRCHQKKKSLTASVLEKGAEMAKEKLNVP